jgi:hypothetical protein
MRDAVATAAVRRSEHPVANDVNTPQRRGYKHLLGHGASFRTTAPETLTSHSFGLRNDIMEAKTGFL